MKTYVRIIRTVYAITKIAIANGFLFHSTVNLWRSRRHGRSFHIIFFSFYYIPHNRFILILLHIYNVMEIEKWKKKNRPTWKIARKAVLPSFNWNHTQCCELKKYFRGNKCNIKNEIHKFIAKADHLTFLPLWVFVFISAHSFHVFFPSFHRRWV